MQKAPLLQPSGTFRALGGTPRPSLPSPLAAWRKRIQPSTPHHAWRGLKPWLRSAPLLGFNPFCASGALVRTSGPLDRLTLFTVLKQRWVVVVPFISAWRILGVSTGGTPFAPLRCEPLGLSFSTSAYLLRTWNLLFRGLGGLCRLKMRYKGKSFKWHRRRGSLLLRFGHAHLTFVYPQFGVRWRRQGRMRLVLFGSNWWDLVAYAQAMCAWRPMNVYHGRGIRLRRQTVLRKAGKVSAYR